MEIKALVENEKTKNYSDLDDIEFIKYLGAQPLESDKLKLLQPILDGSVPQQKLIALCCDFYSRTNPSQAKKLADLWLQNIEKVESSQHRDYFEAFFLGLSPRHLRD